MGIAIIIPDVSFSDTNLGKVTLVNNVAIKGLAIDVDDILIGTQVDLIAAFSPINTSQRNVVWNIVSGGQYASISDSTLNINQGALYNEVTIRCTSLEDSTIYDTKTIKVVYDDGQTVSDTGYYNANLTSDGSIVYSVTAGYILSTLKRRITNKQISLLFTKADDLVIGAGNSQIKIGEYDRDGSFIQRQYVDRIVKNTNYSFQLNNNTCYFCICIQISDIDGATTEEHRLNVAKEVYNSLVFNNVYDTIIDLTDFVDYE